MITILVDEDTEGEHRFTVHKDMICVKSKFFKAACSELWTSGREKIVRPPAGTPEGFQVYVEWVYTSQVNIQAEDINEEQAKLMDIYILGDVIDDYQLRNATMKRLMANTRNGWKCVNSRQLHKVYAATTTGSPLRQFIVNWFVLSVDRDDIKLSIAAEPAEFAQELAVAAIEQIAPVEGKEAFKFMKVMFSPKTESD
jgi:hypothetical protein